MNAYTQRVAVLVQNISLRPLVTGVVSLFLVGFAGWLSGVENIVHGLVRFPLWAVVGILLLLSVNLLLVSLRFWQVLAHFGIILPWSVALRANIAGNVAGLVVIPLFGQILGRQSVLNGFGIQPVVNAGLAAYERTLLALISGVFGTIGAVYLLGQSAVAGFLGKIALLEIVMAACGGGLLSLWLGGGSRFERALTGSILARANLARVLHIAGLTLIGQLLILSCFVLGISAISPSLSIVAMFAGSAVISLAASIPISIGGWGVREIAAIYVLGVLGIPVADALAMSVMVGLCSTAVILASAPFCLREHSYAHV